MQKKIEMVRSQKFQRQKDRAVGVLQSEGAQRHEQAPGDQRLNSTYQAYMEKNPGCCEPHSNILAAASPDFGYKIVIYSLAPLQDFVAKS